MKENQARVGLTENAVQVIQIPSRALCLKPLTGQVPYPERDINGHWSIAKPRGNLHGYLPNSGSRDLAIQFMPYLPGQAI
jgi:hypothetical protein